MTVSFDPDEERPFRVLMRPDEGPAWWVRVPAAIGPNDAKNQAREQVRAAGEDASPVKVEEEVIVQDDTADDPWSRYKGEPENVLRRMAGDR